MEISLRLEMMPSANFLKRDNQQRTEVMAENSKIEWCHHTFNPWFGCTKVSTGCANCYAEQLMDNRYGKVQWGKGNPRKRTSDANWKNPIRWNKRAGCFPGKRTRVFCGSLCDWLDDEVPIEWLSDLLNLIRLTPNLDWLLLTKRPENWKKRLQLLAVINTKVANWVHFGNIPENVWIGTSVENQEQADKRIPELLKIPARVRFLSCEPLLGDLDIFNVDGDIHWVICGGESGPHARRMDQKWARNLRD